MAGRSTNRRGLRSKTVATAAYTLGAVGVAFAATDWGVRDALVFAALAVALSFLAEAAVVRLGLLEHHVRPQVAGVPLAALCGWVGVTTFVVRGAYLLEWYFPAWLPTPVLAGLFAVLVDGLVDQRGVDAGAWTYPDHPLSDPRSGDVPWWNYAGWLVLTAVLTWLAGLVGVP
ncbi:MAG: carotenoid biosynthesis protein [Haloarculaceae archaeon]